MEKKIMISKNLPIIVSNMGFKVRNPTTGKTDIFVNYSSKTHRCKYSIDGDIFFETSKGKSEVIKEFIKKLQYEIFSKFSGKSKES